MTEQEQMFLYALLSRVPGKTAQQKLNYIQDWAKGFNVDLFGTPQEYQPSAQPVAYNKTAEMYAGKGNTALDAIFNSIEQGVDPITAVEQAGGEKLPGAYDPITKKGIDYTALAQQYASDKFEADRQLAEWSASENQKATKFYAEQPTNLGGLFSSRYNAMSEAAGQPLTADLLLQQYGKQQGASRLRSAHVDPSKPVGLFDPNNPERNRLIEEYVKGELAKRLEEAKNQFVVSSKGQQFMKALPMLGFGSNG